MKAIICTTYGPPDVLQLKEMDTPTPKDNEVLIRIYAASVTTADGMMRKEVPKYARLFLGLRRPKNPIPGTGFAGMIEATGKNVSRFKEGVKVFGAHAEYVCVPEDGLLAIKPAKIGYEELAPI